MSIRDMATTCVGKAVRAAARIRGGGSAFPGKVVERIDPGYLARELGRLPLGVVLVSGTNGKTTTTRMVASMLSDLGLKVFTNPTGSNFVRGVVSAVLAAASPSGRLDADIAVLELDEAYAVHFVRQVRPRYALLLNVMRDQLDRFGEIDTTARLLSHVAEATTGTVVLNREDPRIAALAAKVRAGAKVRYFGLAEDLRRFFPSDDDMATTVSVEDSSSTPPQSEGLTSEGLATPPAGTQPAGDGPASVPVASVLASPASRSSASVPTGGDLPADVTLTAVGDHRATFIMGAERAADDDAGLADAGRPDAGRPEAERTPVEPPAVCSTTVKLEGVYNLYNAAAALAMVRAVQAGTREMEGILRVNRGPLLGRALKFANASTGKLITAVSHVTPAFGRGEVIDVDGSPVELLLVKNPMGFRLSLASFDPAAASTMIVINDEYADGRDMSWLWDVDFTSLRASGVAMVSGVRAWDMALRLEYDQVPVAATNTDIEAALATFVKANPGKPKHIYCTYTSMLRVRAALARVAHVADAGVGK